MPTYLCINEEPMKRHYTCVYVVRCYNLQSQMFLKMCCSGRIKAAQRIASTAHMKNIGGNVDCIVMHETSPCIVMSQLYQEVIISTNSFIHSFQIFL